jgi:hypothetical protein
MTLDAGGSGSYEGFNPGTVSGGVSGNVNSGTWHQPGNPPKNGTFKFTLSPGGKSFSGEWAYDTGGCGSACGWNGTCIEGPCLQNGQTTVAPPPPQKCLAVAFRACPVTPANVRPKLGNVTSYTAPQPGQTAAIPTPALGRRDRTLRVRISNRNTNGTPTAPPPVAGIDLSPSDRNAIKAYQLCYILMLTKDSLEAFRSFGSCVTTVFGILERNDEIQRKKQQGANQAQAVTAATPCRSVKVKRRGKRVRPAVKVRCKATASGIEVTFRKQKRGPSLRKLFGRKSRLVVGRSAFDAPVAAGDRVNVLWRAKR